MSNIAPKSSALKSGPTKPGPNRRQWLAGASALTAATAITPAKAQDAVPAINVEGKFVLITGTSSGFGRLAAEHLARNGAIVIASMRNFNGGKREEAQELMDLANDEKLALKVVEIDVNDEALIASGVSQAEGIAGGGLDVLLNNAGIGLGGPIEINDPKAVYDQVNTNLLGYHRMAHAALPAMRKRGEGLLVQISSQLGRFVLPNIGVYCATKFGVEAMFEAMAYELAPLGVDVTIIQPGGYPTKIWENGGRYAEAMLARNDDERKEAYAAHLQMAAGMTSAVRTTDPMDVPRAIAEVISLPNGKRPLRRAVHPNTQAVDGANAAMTQIQAAVLGGGPYKKWHDAVVG